jgi:hypothetical protein
MNKWWLAVIIPITVLVAVAVNAGYTGYVNSINYSICCGGYFDSADRASDLPTKISFFKTYMDGLQREGLDKGCNAVFDCNRPAANNTEQFKIAKSLLTRMENATTLTGIEKSYEIDRITKVEFCWFPNNAFHQAYQIKHNNWGQSLFAPGQVNNCMITTTNSAGDTVQVPAFSD